MRKVKIGLVQVDMDSGGDILKKQENLLYLAQHCCEENADIVFFPEAYQYTQDRDILKRPDELVYIVNEFKLKCAELAKKYHSHIVPWDYEVDDGKFYNISYILDRYGEEVGKYRKVHLPYEEIVRGISSGNEFPVFDLDFGKVGIMICFDNYYPESARILGNKGAELVLYPLYGDTLIPQWELKMRARAVDNSMYIASSQLSHGSDIAYTGIVNPKGDVISRIDGVATWRVVDIDIGQRVITHTTGNNNYSEDIRIYLERCRQPEAYSDLLNPPAKIAEWDDIFLGKIPK
jgi:Predicted amidohydrolase